MTLLQFLLRHCLVGVVAGWGLLAALLASDFAGLWTLLKTSDVWIEATALLFLFFAITFGSLAMGTAVWLLDRKDGGPKQKSRESELPPMGLAPARVRARRR